MYKTLELTLDTERTNNTKTNAQNFLVNTNDYDSVKIIADIVQDKERVDLSDATVKLAIRKPDQTIVFQDGTVTAAIEGECEFVLETQSYVLKGTHVAEVMIYFLDGKIVVTRAFAYHVAEGILSDTAIESTSWYQDVNELQLAVQELQVEVDAFIATAVEETRAEITEVDTRLTSQLADTAKRFDSNEVRFTAHRGLNNAYPENTLLAFEMAALAGYKVIELDIQPTSDGHLVVHHDLTVDRMTNGTGNVATKTLAEIQALVVDGGVGATEYPNLKVPTLEESLVLFRKYNVEPMIEFKLINDYAQLDTLIALLKKYGFEYKSSIISSVTYLIDEFRKRGGKAEALYLNTVTPESTALLQGYGNCGYALNYTDTTQQLIQDIHDDGLSVAVYTVNDTTIARRLASWGADYITSDTIRGVA